MYKVTYYILNYVKAKEFESFSEACAFAQTVKTGDVIEIKLIDNSPKKENRT